MIWRFDEFVHGVVSERGIISSDMPADARAELFVILTEHLGVEQYIEWPKRREFKPLGDGMGEIKFSCGNLEYRIYTSLGVGTICRMWLVATKNRKRKGMQATDPPDAIAKAKKRKIDFETHNLGRLRTYVEKD